ncbi:MAG TPA: carboxypeptidase-like regulatory domain-containing protein [Kaistella chaponensis]|uniref:carboxypeptidase-like regulatory domain-containing protein n=1 Tax=Kaistella chaponensis TaxID=713588 RepID=UPI002CB85772|nr:carboxypeptidase-like regulatory domain-containing protein [Kaistella chaponensis]HPW89702.1 carboxypeptidase-like regulatory domain-containing protein [Kaistella chaponensis]HQC06296.1 carboxypeptidase-like regulatory domain-containing protein [Kaistella chaponensis]
MKLYFFLFFLITSTSIFSQKVSGIVTDEEGNPLPATLVFNLQTEQKSYTDLKGSFSIDANPNQELRFIRVGFERFSKIISSQDFNYTFRISLYRIPGEIEEVQVPVRLTGDLNIDSRNLTRFDKVAQLRAEIGVPAPPEKPREKVADAKDDILKPLLRIPPMVNVQAVYDVISGRAKKKKRLYRYEDLQENIAWIREKVGDEYFLKMGIKPTKISEFLQFSIGVKPDLNKYVKAKNVSKVLLLLEETFPLYLKR